MKAFLYISFLFLLSCSVEETEPQIIEEYFFKKTVENPTILPKAVEIKGIYTCKVKAVGSTETASFDPVNFEFLSTLTALNDLDFDFTLPQDCLFKCDNTHRLNPQIKLKAKINGFNVIIPNQEISRLDGGGSVYDTYQISNGSGLINRTKNIITITFRIVFNRVEKMDFTYTLTKKI